MGPHAVSWLTSSSPEAQDASLAERACVRSTDRRVNTGCWTPRTGPPPCATAAGRHRRPCSLASTTQLRGLEDSTGLTSAPRALGRLRSWMLPHCGTACGAYGALIAGTRDPLPTQPLELRAPASPAIRQPAALTGSTRAISCPRPLFEDALGGFIHWRPVAPPAAAGSSAVTGRTRFSTWLQLYGQAEGQILGLSPGSIPCPGCCGGQQRHWSLRLLLQRAG